MWKNVIDSTSYKVNRSKWRCCCWEFSQLTFIVYTVWMTALLCRLWAKFYYMIIATVCCFLQFRRFVVNGIVSGPASQGSYETKKTAPEVDREKENDLCINSPEIWRFSDLTWSLRWWLTTSTRHYLLRFKPHCCFIYGCRCLVLLFVWSLTSRYKATYGHVIVPLFNQ